MKFNSWMLPLLVLPAFTGCIKDEAPNIEADITAVHCAQEGKVLAVVINDDHCQINVYSNVETDCSDLPLEFEISEGATIQPDPLTVIDYTVPRTFSVTSEDGQWTRTYTVQTVAPGFPTKFSFENWVQPEGKKYVQPYELFTEYGHSEEMHIWACGNSAFSFLAGRNDDYTIFPTFYTNEAHGGQHAAKLVTRATGQEGREMAAGNLYVGQFDASQMEPKNSTQFGLPFIKKPVRLTGWYNYKSAGATYKTGQQDRCRIQAVLYRTDAQLKHLNGFNVNSTHEQLPNIIARAELPQEMGHDTGGYQYFDLTFNYFDTVNSSLLATGGYNLAVIFSASVHGDDYDGAIGSTLMVDDVEIVCE